MFHHAAIITCTLYTIGGPDGRYTLSDLYNLSSDKLVHHPQEVYGSIHSTLVHHYNDTQFFVVNAEPEGATTIRVSDSDYRLVK